MIWGPIAPWLGVGSGLSSRPLFIGIAVADL